MRGDRYIVNVEGAIAHDNRYLMIVRSQHVAHAPGTLTMPGGKVEGVGDTPNVLEETLHREIMEEVGVRVHDRFYYLESRSFVADTGTVVVDVVFLCAYRDGEPGVAAPAEVAEVLWMTADEVLAHPRAQPWTRQSIRLAEARRTAI